MADYNEVSTEGMTSLGQLMGSPVMEALGIAAPKPEMPEPEQGLKDILKPDML